MNMRTLRLSFLMAFVFFASAVYCGESHAFWLWDPKTKKFEDPKYAVKDTPQEQFDWAMRFYKANNFKQAVDEFIRLCEHYKDSDVAPEARYLAGRCYEELGKYLFAYEQYQKVVEDYPYTKRMDEILKREFNIANIFQAKSSPKLMDMELNVSLEKATTIYNKIVQNSAFCEYADKSLFNAADCYRRLRKYKEAMDSYDKLITDYPNSSLIQEAKYQLAQVTYEASLDPEYDQENTDDAIKKFEKISKTTPVPAIAKEADKAMGALRDKKSSSLNNTAAFYEKQGQYESAILYYQEVVDDFPDTQAGKIAAKKIQELQKRVKKK